MKARYNVGNVVVIVKDISGHGITIGEKVKVTEVDNCIDDPGYVVEPETKVNFFSMRVISDTEVL